VPSFSPGLAAFYRRGSEVELLFIAVDLIDRSRVKRQTVRLGRAKLAACDVNGLPGTRGILYRAAEKKKFAIGCAKSHLVHHDGLRIS
jgi:hypothetical protein